MTHVDYFKHYFQEKGHGTANEICDYLVAHNAKFRCVPERRMESVKTHLKNELGKDYPTGRVCRCKSDGVISYFINKSEP
jgi:hypothetical protein